MESSYLEEMQIEGDCALQSFLAHALTHAAAASVKESKKK